MLRILACLFVFGWVLVGCERSEITTTPLRMYEFNDIPSNFEQAIARFVGEWEGQPGITTQYIERFYKSDIYHERDSLQVIYRLSFYLDNYSNEFKGAWQIMGLEDSTLFSKPLVVKVFDSTTNELIIRVDSDLTTDLREFRINYIDSSHLNMDVTLLLRGSSGESVLVNEYSVLLKRINTLPNI